MKWVLVNLSPSLTNSNILSVKKNKGAAAKTAAPFMNNAIYVLTNSNIHKDFVGHSVNLEFVFLPDLAYHQQRVPQTPIE